VPRQRRQGRTAGLAQIHITEGTHMSEHAATGPIRTTLIDISQLHRLPRMPGGL
jgi:hypothetical protein